jgi:WD40 repeat protein
MRIILAAFIVLSYLIPMNSASQTTPIQEIQKTHVPIGNNDAFPNTSRGIIDINNLGMTQDGLLIVTTDFYKMFVWNTTNGEIVREFNPSNDKENGDFDYISAVNISPNGNYAACGGRQNYTFLWRMDSLAKPLILRGIPNDTEERRLDPVSVKKIDFSKDSSECVTIDSFGSINLWDVKTGKKIFRWNEIYRQQTGRGVGDVIIDKNYYIHGYSASNDPTSRYTRQYDEDGYGIEGIIVVDDLTTGETVQKFLGEYYVLSKDRSAILTLYGYPIKDDFTQYTHVYTVYDFTTGNILNKRKIVNGYLPKVYGDRISISPDGKRVLIGSYKWLTMIFKKCYFPRTLYGDWMKTVLFEYPSDESSKGGEEWINDDFIAFFPDGKKFLTVNQDTIKIWDISGIVEGKGDNNN